jgi:hypothetical protein
MPRASRTSGLTEFHRRTTASDSSHPPP